MRQQVLEQVQAQAADPTAPRLWLQCRIGWAEAAEAAPPWDCRHEQRKEIVRIPRPLLLQTLEMWA
jgi:hypothetical protein